MTPHIRMMTIIMEEDVTMVGSRVVELFKMTIGISFLLVSNP